MDILTTAGGPNSTILWKLRKGARSDGMQSQIWNRPKFRKQAENRLLILTHHLKGLALSFQNIIKSTDQRN